MSAVTITNGRYTVEPLYQWDLNQVLTIYGLSLESIPEIHFTHTDMDRAIVRQSTMDDAGVISVDIPNSLLQKPYKITAYVCIYEGDTFKSLYAINIPVKARSKPSDYTLEDDEELYSFNALENQIVNLTSLIEDHNSLDDELTGKYNELADKYNQTNTDINNKYNQLHLNVVNQLSTFSRDLEGKDKKYLTDTLYGLTQDNFNDLFISFLSDAVQENKIALITSSYEVVNDISVNLDKVRLESMVGCKFTGAGKIDFRNVTDLYCKNLIFESPVTFQFYGDDEKLKQPLRQVLLDNCITKTNTGVINSGLYISTPKPINGYDDRSKDDYTRYCLELFNNSGYNALMITNMNLDDDGNLVDVGAIDNSAIGIIDKVKGVASPVILIDGGYRHLLRFVSSESDNDLLDISADGRIAIGCNTNNDDENVSGMSVIKVYYPNPGITIKDSNTDNLLAMYLSGANFNVEWRGYPVISGNNTDGYQLAPLKNGVNNGLTFKNGQIYIDSNGHMAMANYAYLGDETSGHLIQNAHASTTADRPTYLTDTDKDRGYMIFDKTLNKPIWWTGTKWVDATGANV